MSKLVSGGQSRSSTLNLESYKGGLFRAVYGADSGVNFGDGTLDFNVCKKFKRGTVTESLKRSLI